MARMNRADTIQTVTRYLAHNYKTLKGAMPVERYFMIGGQSSGDVGAPSRLVLGTAVDALAEAIEKGVFFGDYVDEHVEQATNCNNTRLVPVNDGDTLHGPFKISLSTGRPILVAERVTPRVYMDCLRTLDGFKQQASLLEIPGNLEKMAATIYSR